MRGVDRVRIVRSVLLYVDVWKCWVDISSAGGYFYSVTVIVGIHGTIRIS